MELALADDTSPVEHPLHDVLARLGDRVAPIALARERTMPVAEPLRTLFPEQGLVRGRVLACQGAAASSIALSIVRDALIEGAWLAVVDVATFGADAAAELEVPLERVVRIDTEAASSSSSSSSSSGQCADWVDVMGAAADGFDIVITRVPPSLQGGRGDRRPASVRKLATRLQQRGAVVVILGAPGAMPSDVTLTTSRTVWSGLGQGSGHLRRRRIDVEASGRRTPGTRTCSLDLTGATGHVEISAATDGQPGPRSSGNHVSDVSDPQEQVLAEMAAAESSPSRIRVRDRAEPSVAQTALSHDDGDLDDQPLAAG